MPDVQQNIDALCSKLFTCQIKVRHWIPEFRFTKHKITRRGVINPISDLVTPINLSSIYSVSKRQEGFPLKCNICSDFGGRCQYFKSQ